VSPSSPALKTVYGIGRPWVDAPLSFAQAFEEWYQSTRGAAFGSGYSFWLSQDPRQANWYLFEVIAGPTVPSNLSNASGSIGLTHRVGAFWNDFDGPFDQGCSFGMSAKTDPTSVLRDFKLAGPGSGC
jgi:hypothetical protein